MKIPFSWKAANPCTWKNQLVGRFPVEAIQSTQILSTTSGVSHGLAAVSALENYLQLDPTPASLQIRQIMHQLATIRAHIFHFYFELLPDYLNNSHFPTAATAKPFLRFDFHPLGKKRGRSVNEGGD